MILEWGLGKISACFLGLINSAVGYGLGVWIPFWISWRVSHLLGFLMDTLYDIFFSGHPDSVLCILSQTLGYLYVVVVGIEYY